MVTSRVSSHEVTSTGILPAAPAPQNLGQVISQEWELPKSKFLIKSRGFPLLAARPMDCPSPTEGLSQLPAAAWFMGQGSPQQLLTQFY